MRWNNVCIESIGHVLPTTRVTSAEIEAKIAPTMARFGCPPGRLIELTGIKERRLFDNDVQPSEVAAQAGQVALQRAGIDAKDLDLLISTSIIRDYIEPSIASLVGGNLNTGNHCSVFDVSHACCGFVEGLVQAANAIELGQVEHAMVVSGENFAPGVRNTLEILSDPNCDVKTFFQNYATLTLGCGAVAVVLTPENVSKAKHRIRCATKRTNTDFNRLCVATKLQMTADAQTLKVQGTELVSETFGFFLEELGRDKTEFDHFICHQVGLRHIEDTLNKIDMPLKKAYLTLPYLGNCGSAALPITLAEAYENKILKPGDNLCFFAIGSGLGCILMDVEW
jgi:acyl-CoA:acyl-CoA alkyltransferase